MHTQLGLFQIDAPPIVPERFGQAQVRGYEAAQILTPASGFMQAYDYTLNPYAGCGFGCAYCYAAFFVDSADKRENWGGWVEVKQNAVELLRKRRSLAGKRVYMSSVTDPYQPIEAKIELTRRILEVLDEAGRQPRLVIQTRSPLVTRDIDLLRRFEHLRVNLTITTDSEEVRKRFESHCPGNDRRIAAVEELKASGIKVGVCVTPMLPLRDPDGFARRLAGLRADVYVAQPFKASSGRFAASTRQMALDIIHEYDWTEDRYSAAFALLRRHLPTLREGAAGFMPE